MNKITPRKIAEDIKHYLDVSTGSLIEDMHNIIANSSGSSNICIVGMLYLFNRELKRMRNSEELKENISKAMEKTEKTFLLYED